MVSTYDVADVARSVAALRYDTMGQAEATWAPSRRARWILLGELLLMITVFFLLPLNTGGLGWRLLLYGLGILLVVGVVFRQVARHLQGADNAVRVDSLILALVLSTLLFALSYAAIDAADPGQIDGLSTRLDALYFSVTIVATVGFGDVHAVGQFSRGFVTVQMVFDLVIIAAAVPVLTRSVAARRRRSIGDADA